jgi:hypothetical protein
VFGTLNYHNVGTRNNFVADLLKLAGIEDAFCNRTHVWVWRRIPHPDTLVSSGPELDFGIITDNTVVFGESKWNSGVSQKQGKSKVKSQMQLRVEFLQKYGADFFKEQDNKMVLLISREPDNSYNTLSGGGVKVQNLIWSEVCDIPSHPLNDEVKRYYHWKTTV